MRRNSTSCSATTRKLKAETYKVDAAIRGIAVSIELPGAGESILWRRLDRPGHEFARVYSQTGTWRLAGTAAFLHEERPSRLDYLIVCNSEWRTLTCQVTGWLGDRSIDIHVTADADGKWLLNDVDCPIVAGCVDVDLNFSPSTNLLPIRRLKLEIGEEAVVQAAWLRFPSFKLERLDQKYRRLGPAAYRYESAGGSFVTELEVNSAGLVTRYPNLCEAEAK